MPELAPKLAILAALRHEPDFSYLRELPSAESKHGRRLLLWLDKSGLALSFLPALQRFDVMPRISMEWKFALWERRSRNLERTKDMLGEFQRLNAAFRERGIAVAALKGFTLVPDFCEDASLRHQADFDFLVSQADLAKAAAVLRSLGYFAPQLNKFGETSFSTPLRRIPSVHDDLYNLPQHRQADLHTSLWEESDWLTLSIPTDCLQRVQTQFLYDVEFFSLSLEDKFLLQVLHAFRHASRSWLRVSWLLEIARFLQKHKESARLWSLLIERAGDSGLTRRVFALVLGLVHRLFHSPVPQPLRTWVAGATSASLEAWLEHFALEWSLSDWPGSLNNLFLADEFIPDPARRRQYLWSRFLPRMSQMSVASVSIREPMAYFKLQLRRAQYVAQRALLHGKDVCGFPLQQYRWKRTLYTAGKREYIHNW